MCGLFRRLLSGRLTSGLTTYPDSGFGAVMTNRESQHMAVISNVFKCLPGLKKKKKLPPKAPKCQTSKAYLLEQTHAKSEFPTAAGGCRDCCHQAEEHGERLE